MSRSHFHPSAAADIPRNYERFFVPAIGRPVAAQLVGSAELRPGERVLDVGCGTGIVSRMAAERVGAEGKVIGLDINPGMLAVARSSAPAASNIEWCEADAGSIPLPDEAFDVVLCQMSLQFIPDPEAALREMRRVLRPGGRLLLNVPGPAAPLFESLAQAVGRHIRPEAAGFVRQVFSLNDPGDLERLLARAQFPDVTVETYQEDLSLPGPQDFLWQYIEGTPLAIPVSQADDASRRALEDEVVSDWREFEDGKGMDCQQRMILARGTR